MYPIGASLVALPVVFALDAAGVVLADGKIERVTASIVVALTAVLLYLLARRSLGVTGSLVVALIFAFCTAAWSTATRALWQHGPSMLMLTLGLWILVLARDRPRLVQLAATSAGVLLRHPTDERHRHRRHECRGLARAPAVFPPLPAVGGSSWPSRSSRSTGPCTTRRCRRTTWRRRSATAAASRRRASARSRALAAGCSCSRPSCCSPSTACGSRRGARDPGSCARGHRAPALDRAVVVSDLVGRPLVRLPSLLRHGAVSHLLPGPGRRAHREPVRRAARRSGSTGFACLVAISFVVNFRGATARAVYRWNADPVDVDVQPDRVWDWRDPPVPAPA